LAAEAAFLIHSVMADLREWRCGLSRATGFSLAVIATSGLGTGHNTECPPWAAVTAWFSPLRSRTRTEPG
jgi:hypothetical protein